MFIRTERLFLRPPWDEDASGLTRAIAHAPVAQRLARVPWPYEEADAAAWIGAPRDPLCPALLVTLPDDHGRIIGGCGLHQDTAEAPVEVGIWITPAWQRQDFGREALRGLLQIARTIGHDRVLARHAAGDVAAAALIVDAGFRQIATTGSSGEVTYALRLRGGGDALPGAWQLPEAYPAGIDAAA